MIELTVIQFAKKFAENGFYVFPMYDSPKGPQKPYGWARNEVANNIAENKIIPATNQVSEIDTWIQRLKSGYKSKLVAYGVLGLDCIIFDLDNKDGKNGLSEFKKLMTKFKIPVPELIVKSKSAGFHLYYKKPEKFKNAKVKTMANIIIDGVKYEGVDVRGDGGMVIGPLNICKESEWQRGLYSIIKGDVNYELSEMPKEIIIALNSKSFMDPLENMIDSTSEKSDEDVMDLLKRGEIPKSLPKGARNQGFFIFINALRNKGFNRDTTRMYAQKLMDVTEGGDDIKNSVDIDEMINRIFQVDVNNPYDVARDLIDHGLYRITGLSHKLKYVCLNDNPYYSSTNFHDITAMKQLLSRYARSIPQPNGKDKLVNPADILDKIIPPDRDADMVLFKAGEEHVFFSGEYGGKRFLNTWKDPRLLIRTDDLDINAYDQFLFIISRIFGDEKSDEFQLGIDLPAWVLQKPGQKPIIVPFIQSSNRGVGKSCYLNSLRYIMGVSLDGNEQARSLKIEEIGARFFNPNGASILMLDEVQFPTHRNMRQESTTFWKHLKTLITDHKIPVEFKGGGVFQAPNVAAMIMAGNNNNHFPIEEADRRVWIIDNNPPILAKGLADKLFDLEKPTVPFKLKHRTINSIRYWLNKHHIKLQLSEMRAPMNDLKREMYILGLTDIEAWFITHFENPENISARSPVVTKEMILYALQTSDEMIQSKWAQDPEDAFRELRRRGLVRSIRVRGNMTLTRQLVGFPNVNSHGLQVTEKGKFAVFTCREHNEFNFSDNDFLKECLQKNVDSIVEWRNKSIKLKRTNLIS